MIAAVENAYQPKRAEALLLINRLIGLVNTNEAANRDTRNWGDVGDMERVLSAVQVAVDVLEVV